MSGPAFALEPGPRQRTITAAISLYVLLLVAVPLAALVHAGFADGLTALWDTVRAPVAREALWLTVWTALLIALLNALLGTATAWAPTSSWNCWRSCSSAIPVRSARVCMTDRWVAAYCSASARRKRSGA